MAKWWGEGLVEQYGEQLWAFDRYPEDVALLLFEPLNHHAMDLSWEIATEGAHDTRAIIDNWTKLEEFISKLPDPQTDPMFDALSRQAAHARAGPLRSVRLVAPVLRTPLGYPRYGKLAGRLLRGA